MLAVTGDLTAVAAVLQRLQQREDAIGCPFAEADRLFASVLVAATMRASSVGNRLLERTRDYGALSSFLSSEGHTKGLMCPARLSSTSAS